MGDNTHRWLTGVAGVVAVLLAGAQVGAGAVAPDSPPFAITLVLASAFLTYCALGVVVVRRARGHRIGWLLLATGLLFLIGAAAENGAKQLHGQSEYRLVTAWLSWVDSWAWTGALGLVVMVILLFPSGHLPSRRWSAIGVLVATVTGVGVVEAALRPGRLEGGAHVVNPIGFHATAGVLGSAANLAQFGTLVALMGSLAALVSRRRAADEVERQQLRWVTVAMAVALGSVPLVPLGAAIHLPLVGVTFLLVVVVIPLAVAVSVLRYRLYDLDLVVNRVAVYGLLLLSVTALYVALVAIVGLLVYGQIRPNLAVSALSSAIVALAVAPLRDRLRGVVARIVLGHRATPYQVLAELADHLRSGWTLDAVLPQMTELLAGATGATMSVVYLRSEQDFRPVAIARPGSDDSRVPALCIGPGGELLTNPPAELDLLLAVEEGQEILGAVGIRKEQRSPVTPADRRLVEQLASHAALLFENLRLTAALERRVEEVAAQASELAESRRRLVTAQDDERRRIERDIHDGAQQDLVAMMAKVRLAQNALRRDGAVSESALVELQDDLRRALGELRELAHGIFPPVLADRGLVAAVEARSARFPIPVDVEVDEDTRSRRLALAVEGALYFVTSEALANVLKHAQASSVRVRVTTLPDETHVEICDDGRGLGSSHWGMGLTGMSDRVAALGGRLSVSPGVSGGTVVVASVPTVGVPQG
ncbi:MAG: hypothetical protein NVS3B21_12720 [Acidimicrobiales bacterium]